MKILLTRRILPVCLLTLLLTGLAFSGLLSGPNNTLADFLYQRSRAVSDQIVLVGIDQPALEALGSWPWSRDVMGQVLDNLNADPEQRPAVIGLDALFVGETDPEADMALVEAAGRYGNVVTATAATFGVDFIKQNNGDVRLDDYAILTYDEPFDALRAVTEQGHINAMLDKDGILRHAIWQIDLSDGQTVPSFHQKVYQMYQTAVGEAATLVPPMDARHRWYVPLQGLPGDFHDGISVLDLYEGTVEPALFADKIVLIGPYAAGLQDSYPTAIDHAAQMYGVEYQANTIAALLAGDMKQEVMRWPQMVALFVILLAAFLWLHKRKVQTSTVLWLVLSLGWIGICLGAYALGYVLQPLYVPLFLTVAYIISVASSYIRERMEKGRVTATFQRYVAPEIVAELLRDDPQTLDLGGKLCDIAVLFVDIRGFTSMSEGLAPHTVVEIINRYLTLTSECIFRHGGTLDKYVGDCTMAIWGAPLPQEDCAYKAVLAALDMTEHAKELGEALQRQYGQGVGFGVGVHYGPAVVGNIGSPTRMDYTAIGDTVNTAARLESNAPAGQILVSRTVADALAGRVLFTSLGDQIRLKGKSEGFEILRVEGLVSNDSTATSNSKG